MTPEEIIKLRQEAQAQAEKYQSEIDKCNHKIEEAENRIRQIKNKQRRAECTLKTEARKIRNHRLIERGAILESLLPDNGQNMSNDEILEFLKTAFRSIQGREF